MLRFPILDLSIAYSVSEEHTVSTILSWLGVGINGYEIPSAVSLTKKPLWYEIDPNGRMVSDAAYLRLKRWSDIVIGTMLLFLTSPILLLCILAIKLESPGPVLFVQQRTGQGGRLFKMYKLRTMVKDAASLKTKYQHLNTHTFPDFKIRNDPRITRIGHFLRKTSLDELPQLFNVILGGMTLVGPRPTSFSASTYALWHTARLEVKPGITGLWQISGRCNIDFSERVRLDIAYVRNRSFWLDLRILFRTLTCVIRGEGAE